MEGAKKCVLTTFKNKKDGSVYRIKEDYMTLLSTPCVIEILEVGPIYGVKYNSSTWKYQEDSKFAYFDNEVSTVEHYRSPAPVMGNTHMVYTARTLVVSWHPSEEEETRGIFILKACDHLCHTFVDKNDQKRTVTCCDEGLEKITSSMMRPVFAKLLFKDRLREKEMIMRFVPGCARCKWDPPPGAFEFRAKQHACWYCKVDESALEPFTFAGFLQHEGRRLHPNAAENTSISIIWMTEKEDNRSKQVMKGIMEDPSTLAYIKCSDGKMVACHPFILAGSSDVLQRLVSHADSDSHNSSFTKADAGCIAEFKTDSSTTEFFINYLYTKNANHLQTRTLQEIFEVLCLAHEYQVDQLVGSAMAVIMEKEDVTWFEIEDLIQLYSFVRLLVMDCEFVVKFNKKMLAIMRQVMLQSKNKRVRPNESGDKEETVLVSMMKEKDYQQILKEWVADLVAVCASHEE